MKKVKLELTEEDAAVLMMMAGLAVSTHGRYPYERVDGQEGYEEWRTEHNIMCKKYTLLTKAYCDLTGSDGGVEDLARLCNKYLPFMALIGKDSFLKVKEIEDADKSKKKD